MHTCAHFTDVGQSCCAMGVNYQALAGGGTFTLVLRLPCLPISNRRGEEVRTCAMHSESAMKEAS